jgi:hypothetical protein
MNLNHQFKTLLLCSILFFSPLIASCPMTVDFKKPTEQLIRRDSWSKIEKHLDSMKIASEYHHLFNSIAENEDWGHIGYHGANQDFRIYQDIIRLVVDQILQIPIREDFHFLRIPGDIDLNLNTVQEFHDYWGKLDNKGEKGKQLLSFNLGIYANHDVKGSCSIHLFIHDKSKNDINYIKQLTPFFKTLGLDPSSLRNLFDIAHQRLFHDGGILLKIAENSHLSNPDHLAYNYADDLCYPAKQGGHPYGNYSFSNHIERMLTDQYLKHKLDIAPQYRLLINNKIVLNPFSVIEIKRWDLYDSETIKLYENEMRQAISSLKYDPEKAAAFRHYLLEIWR